MREKISNPSRMLVHDTRHPALGMAKWALWHGPETNGAVLEQWIEGEGLKCGTAIGICDIIVTHISGILDICSPHGALSHAS